jgi:hypothetical protein
MNRVWRKSRAIKTRFVNFALGRAEVKLISYFDYRDGECKGGRIYRVADIRTGRQDVVGIEHLEANAELTGVAKRSPS